MKTASNPFDKRFLTYDEKGPRDEQQDSSISLVSSKNGTALVVVSDGVGGKSGGRLASKAVRDTAIWLWEKTEGRFADPQAALAQLCRAAHEGINDVGRKNDMSPRATIVAVYLTDRQAWWAHSGDSRLYHFRSGQYLERTLDHSVVQVLVKQGLAKESEMGTHPDQGTLLQSLGGEDYKEPSFGTAPIQPQDGFLLCTDGFWERTPVEDMGRLVAASAAEVPALMKTAVQTAVQRNGPKGDNVTLAVALPVTPGIAPLPPQVRSAAAAATGPAPVRTGPAPAHSQASAAPSSGSSFAKILIPCLAIMAGLIGGVVIAKYFFEEKKPQAGATDQDDRPVGPEREDPKNEGDTKVVTPIPAPTPPPQPAPTPTPGSGPQNSGQNPGGGVGGAEPSAPNQTVPAPAPTPSPAPAPSPTQEIPNFGPDKPAQPPVKPSPSIEPAVTPSPSSPPGSKQTPSGPRDLDNPGGGAPKDRNAPPTPPNPPQTNTQAPDGAFPAGGKMDAGGGGPAIPPPMLPGGAGRSSQP